MPFFSALKRVLVGKPIATKHAHHERLPKVFALPVFASDALSSVAYASEEILGVLVMGSLIGYYKLVPISIALVFLLWTVVFSYYQTINAYPMGGGSYRVSSENLGSMAGRIAGSALLIGYVLTVAVSVSAGTAAIASMFPEVAGYNPLIASAAVAVLAVLNLRGAKESGLVFAIPTYGFVCFILAMVGWGVYKAATGTGPIAPDLPPATQNGAALAFVIAAFARGCTALTGTEAIADGVQAFKPPEAKNAANTLLMMAGLLTVMVIGLSWAAQHYGVVPMDFHEEGYRTVVAQTALKMFGEGPMFFIILTVTALILFLAANTGFADFPRLSQFIAKDGYLPRQLMSVGDRLVYQNGIITLAVLSIILIIGYQANTHTLIPLYAAGVFLSFTLSQAGMVAKFVREGQFGIKAIISGIGALTTGGVTILLVVTRFLDGAWILLAAIAVIMVIMARIRGHYDYLSKELSVTPEDRVEPVKTTVILLVPRLHRGILKAIAYAQSLTDDVRAIHVTLDPTNTKQIKEDWNRFGEDIPLVILESQFRSLIEPITEYIDQSVAEDPGIMVTVIVPQAVPKYWTQSLLHNNAAVPLKMALKSRRNVVITNVRYFLK